MLFTIEWSYRFTLPLKVGRAEIEANMKAIFQAILFSPTLQADQLLHRYMDATGHLRHVLGYKNAQQEAQTEEQARQYLPKPI